MSNQIPMAALLMCLCFALASASLGQTAAPMSVEEGSQSVPPSDGPSLHDTPADSVGTPQQEQYMNADGPKPSQFSTGQLLPLVLLLVRNTLAVDFGRSRSCLIFSRRGLIAFHFSGVGFNAAFSYRSSALILSALSWASLWRCSCSCLVRVGLWVGCVLDVRWRCGTRGLLRRRTERVCDRACTVRPTIKRHKAPANSVLAFRIMISFRLTRIYSL